MTRTVFIISDRTAITAEGLSDSLLTQFDTLEFHCITLPFIDSPEKVQQAVSQINLQARKDPERPLVFSTLVDADAREALRSCDAVFIDFLSTFIGSLEQELGIKSTPAKDRVHSITSRNSYESRMHSVDYALSNDDGGMTRDYDVADVILIGVSRAGKTPTCVYLAIQFGIMAANYPLTPDDIDAVRLPAALAPYKDKIFGLTINPERLVQLRQERLPNSQYASLKQCYSECRSVESMFRRERIPYLDSTSISIEEMAATLLQEKGITRSGH